MVGRFGILVLGLVAGCTAPTAVPPHTHPELKPTAPLPTTTGPTTLRPREPLLPTFKLKPFNPSSEVMRVHLIDVGQGAATLVEFKCGVALVDTGGEKDSKAKFNGVDKLQLYLEEFFELRPELKGTIELLVLTHPHEDHVRGAEMVRDNFTVNNVVTNGRTDVEKPGGGSTVQAELEVWAKKNASLWIAKTPLIAKGGTTNATIDPISCGGADPEIRVLWGQKPQQGDWKKTPFNNPNNHSVVTRFSLGQASFLVSGDLQDAAFPDLIAMHHDSGMLDVGIWQVGHHGSHNGASKELLNEITPAIALMGTGDPKRKGSKSAWAYGHPDEATIQMLESVIPEKRTTINVKVGAEAQSLKDHSLSHGIYATGWDGDVVISATDKGKYTVDTDP